MKAIQTQLSNWSGLALICDAYSGYDWIKEVGRVLCRCSAHVRRDHERALPENPKRAMPGILLFQEIYAVEEIIKGKKEHLVMYIRAQQIHQMKQYEWLRAWIKGI